MNLVLHDYCNGVYSEDERKYLVNRSIGPRLRIKVKVKAFLKRLFPPFNYWGKL